jgi:SAM-dependent methyltransferase
MTLARTAYDEYPYRSYPIEWSAPERLAVTSLLHGGPRLSVQHPYRVLEIGCGDGSNLVPMAAGRPHATFVGLDSAAVPIAAAKARAEASGARNVTFVHADIVSVNDGLEGEFDVILAHGVFSWVPPQTRDALLALCASRLRPGGLVYLNYNARPGWNVRGLVRDYLTNATAAVADLPTRTTRARELAAAMADRLDGGEHPYSQLMANEFRFVVSTDPSHTAHEYLAPDNHCYTRREFMDLAATHGLAYVADADFNYPSGRLPEQLPSILAELPIDQHLHAATADLLCFRQLHSPILTHARWIATPPDSSELADLFVVSTLRAQATDDESAGRLFVHPSGVEVRTSSDEIAAALTSLMETPGTARRLRDLFVDVSEVIDDVRLLHRSGLLDLLSIRTERKLRTSSEASRARGVPAKAAADPTRRFRP